MGSFFSNQVFGLKRGWVVVTQLFKYNWLDFNVYGNRASSSHSQLCTSLKRYASFVFLRGHDGMRLDGRGWGCMCVGGCCTLMRECATTRTSRDFALWHSTKNQFTHKKSKKKRGWWENRFWYANVGVMRDFGAPDSSGWGWVWRNDGMFMADNDWLLPYVPFKELLSAHNTKTLIFNIRAPRDSCGTLCCINKTSEMHFRLYYSAVPLMETDSHRKYSQSQLSRTEKKNATEQFMGEFLENVFTLGVTIHHWKWAEL